jgi:hypothetical protein
MTPLRRRPLLLAALLASASRAQGALPRSATLLVPGPAGGLHARWVERLAAALSQASPAGLHLMPDLLGGPDGVTAGNRFATEAAPDGRTLLVLSGGVAQARLAGDPRAKFGNPGWLPVCASLGCALLVGRVALPTQVAVPLRVAVGAPEGHGPAALLALDLLGLPALPLPGNPASLWQEGQADALLLTGAEARERMQALGAVPWCLLDEPDPDVPGMPTLAELAPAPPPALLAAAQASGASARLQAALVLPALTPADQVALWRAATGRWLEEEARHGGRALAGAEAAPLLAAAAPAPEAVLAYRDWLLRRLGWQGER